MGIGATEKEFGWGKQSTWAGVWGREQGSRGFSDGQGFIFGYGFGTGLRSQFDLIAIFGIERCLEEKRDL